MRSTNHPVRYTEQFVVFCYPGTAVSARRQSQGREDLEPFK